MKSKALTMMVLATIFIIGLFSSITCVKSHTPSDMDIFYEETNEILIVTITHEVSDISSHYIAGVKICLQESEITSYNYTSQPTNDTFTYQYTLAANKGDKIKVAAYCNIEGEIHEDLVVGAITGLNIPGFNNFGLIFMFSIALLVIITLNTIKKIK